MDERQRSVRVDSVILRHMDWGEADRMLVLFSAEMGKLRAIAKGARKPRSRKAGHLEPFTRSSLQLARGRDLWIVTQAETLDAYLPLRDDLLRITYAAYIVELLDRFTYEEGENQSLYELLVDTLKRLAGTANPEMVTRYYEIRLLDFLGFRPQLFKCVTCAKEIRPEDQFFSAEQGGVICAECGRARAGIWPISVSALRYLRHFQRSSYLEAARTSLSETISREMETLVQHYFTYILERNLNTPAFLRRARREAG